MSEASAGDPHSAPVPASAWAADAEARARGRVQIFNATRPGGLDGWTMDLTQYELVRALILRTLRDLGGATDAVPLQEVVSLVQRGLGAHPAFPNGRLRNYTTYTKVDLEARGLVERVVGRGAQQVRLTASGLPEAESLH